MTFSTPFFLWAVLLSGLPEVHSFGDPDFEKLEQRLRSRDKWVRKSAVEKLARDGRVEAWALVVRRLGDSAGEVADTAEVWLSRLDEVVPDRDDRMVILKRLRARDGVASDEAWTRRRTWGAVARLSPDSMVSGLGRVAWKKGLYDRDPQVRAACLEAVASLGGNPPSLGQHPKLHELLERGVQRAIGARETDVVVAAAHAARTLGSSQLVEQARRHLAAKDPTRRVAGLLVAISQPGGAQALTEALRDPAPAVRAAAILASVDLPLEQVAEPLVGRLRDERLALRHWAHAELMRRSGFVHPVNSRAWEAWAHNPRVVERPERPLDDASVALADYRPPSDRVVFLLDFSGSIWRERKDGTRPRDQLVDSARQLFERLSGEVHFEVGVFTNEVEFVEGRLRPAKRSRVAKVSRFVDEARNQGPGDAWGAIEAASRLRGVDTLVLLTDGEPTGGPRHRLEHFPEHWERLTRGRPLRLDVLLVEAPPRIHRAWDAVARIGGGRVRATTL